MDTGSRTNHSRVGPGRPPWHRIAATIVATLCLLGFIVCFGLSQAIATKAPEVALRFNPWQSEALGRSAYAHLQRGGPENIANAEALARRAIMVNPTAVAAVRTLAYAAGMRGDQKRADQMIDQSQALSRRDPMTQVWLIERDVARDSVEGALTHYDIALKTSTSIRNVLIPILVSATADPQLLPPLAKRLAKRPVWRQDFIRSLLTDAPDAANAASLAMMLDRHDAPLAQAEKVTISNRLINERNYATAARLMGRSQQPNLVYNERFEGADDGNPFGWRLKSNADLGAEIGMEEGRPALRIYAANGRGGNVAQQLLMLPVGQYRLTTAMAGAEASANSPLYWTLACAGGSQIALVDLPASANGADLASAVSVPGECPAQWLVLHLRPTLENDVELMVRRVSIAPID